MKVVIAWSLIVELNHSGTYLCDCNIEVDTFSINLVLRQSCCIGSLNIDRHARIHDDGSDFDYFEVILNVADAPVHLNSLW